jgi:two-component system sensor histidine kinase KdpD
MAIDRERLAREAFETETLRRSDAMKTAILRAVSHDLRTPLMAILTSASALDRPDFALSEEERGELLETVLEEARRLDRLVGNLLDLSRLQAGAAPPHLELVSVDDLVVEALESLGEDAARIDVSLPDDPPAVRVDAQQVQRALANLLENALKYSSSAEPVQVRVASTSSEVLLRVIDRGPGVAAGDVERIFAPFQRGSVPSGRGAGLGLAIAQGFAEANEGRVWVESHEGQGATFVLALPVAPIEVGT